MSLLMESRSSLNIDYVLSFFFTINIVRCSGVLRKKKRKFIPKPGMVYPIPYAFYDTRIVMIQWCVFQMHYVWLFCFNTSLILETPFLCYRTGLGSMVETMRIP